MLAIFRSRQAGPSHWVRRTALLALIALEMAVAISPLLEPHHVAPETHIEQSGATHHFLVHNDSTCPVCALRSMGQLPSRVSVVIATAAPSYLATQLEYGILRSRDEAAHAPRAPPIAG
jgi:hypothetical protein